MHVHVRVDARVARHDRAVNVAILNAALGFPIVSGHDPAALRWLQERRYDLTRVEALTREVKKKAPLPMKKEIKALTAIEADLQARLQEAWVAGGQDAVDEVLATFLAGTSAVTQAEIDTMLAAIGARMGPVFASTVGSDVVSAVTDAYDVGRVGLVPEPQFNLVDAKARAWLAQDQQYWIGEYYGEQVSPRLTSAIDEVVFQQGLGRADAGAALRDLFGEEFGPRSDAYWRGTAACAATRSRNFGQIESLNELGFEQMIPVNPRDEATSPICNYLTSGAIVFKVEWAVAQRDAMMAAKTPAGARDASPWLPFDEINGKSADQLQALGICNSPYHFHCRTIMVVL